MQTATLTVYIPQMSEQLAPFFPVPVPAGVGDSVEQGGPEFINIDEYLRRGRGESVAYLKACGDSMKSFGIYDGDLLVVYRASSAQLDDIVVAEVNGEYTIKKLENRHHGGLHLVPGNDDYKARRIKESDSFTIWAVVDTVIHKVRSRAA